MNERADRTPPVVCGVDNSPGAWRSAASAADLAEALGAPLVLAYVRPVAATIPAVPVAAPLAAPVALDAEQRLAQDAEKAVHELVSELEIAPAAVRICANTRVADGLREVVRDHSAQLLVLGSSGHSDLHAAVLGSVTLDAFRDPACPVVAVPPDARLPSFRGGSGESVVCAVDESPAASEALEVARVLASRLGARLVAVHVAEGVPAAAAAPASAAFGGIDLARAEVAQQQRAHAVLDRAAERVGSDLERRLCVGTPTAEAIEAVAQDEDASLIVVGTRGRGAIRSALLGSVSRRLAAEAPVPVAVVSAGASRALSGSSR